MPRVYLRLSRAMGEQRALKHHEVPVASRRYGRHHECRDGGGWRCLGSRLRSRTCGGGVRCDRLHVNRPREHVFRVEQPRRAEAMRGRERGFDGRLVALLRCLRVDARRVIRCRGGGLGQARARRCGANGPAEGCVRQCTGVMQQCNRCTQYCRGWTLQCWLCWDMPCG